MPGENVLLIITDQHALHAVSCYGAPVCRTPHIDALAADGVRFTRAYTPCALCTPARASLLSGLYPHNHGAIFNVGDHLPFDEARIGHGTTIYPELLAARGYRLGYSGKWHAGLRRTASDAGFEGFSLPGYGSVRACAAYRAYLAAAGRALPEAHVEFRSSGDPDYPGDISGWASGPIESAPCHLVAGVADALLRAFAGEGRPFFVVCSFWEPHAPYLPSEDFKDCYRPAQIPPWPSFRDDLAGRPLIHRKHRQIVSRAAAEAGWDTWAQVIARYYAQVSMVDYEVGRLVATLKELGLYSSTTIVFTADHGETIGIHGGAFDKGAMAYEEVYRIPLIIKPAGPPPQAAGGACDAFVSLLDLAPTFCALAGASLPRADGQSLLPLLNHPQAPWRDDLVAEFHGHRVPYGQRILWWRDYKYVLNFADVDELYDLAHDPHEMRNLIDDPDYADILAEMRRRLLSNMKATGDRLGPQAYLFLTRPLRPAGSPSTPVP